MIFRAKRFCWSRVTCVILWEALVGRDRIRSFNRCSQLWVSSRNIDLDELGSYWLTFWLVGPKPKVSEDAFEDLLGGHSFASTKKEPRTIKEMRKELDVRDLDPDQLKVNDHRRVPYLTSSAVDKLVAIVGSGRQLLKVATVCCPSMVCTVFLCDDYHPLFLVV